MRCYTAHKNIVTFMKMTNDMDNNICIYPSSVLLGMCCEVNLSEPVYLEVSKELFKFQFSVQSIGICCKGMENDDTVSATGYSFRNKPDAIESAALAMLDLLMYRYGIKSTLYSDLVFVKHWPAYSHISENVKVTSSTLLDIASDISSLIDGINECGRLFEAEELRLRDGAGHSDEVGGSWALATVLNNCNADLQSIYQSLSTRIREHTECVWWRCHSHRFYHKVYYEAVHSMHSLDIKMECIRTLKVTLGRVCHKCGYTFETLSSSCVSENSYTAEMVLIKRCGSAELEKRFVISSANFKNIHECKRDVIYRAISTLCATEGLKIIDAGYLDLRDMQKESRSFQREVPLLCDIVGKMKIILEDGFKNIDVLSQQYYRRLKDSRLSRELRLSDCICEFIHIIKGLDGEVKKMEIYSSNLASHCEDVFT